MNKRLQTIVLVDSTGMASPAIEESLARLYIANPLRIFSACTEANDFVSRVGESTATKMPPAVGAIVLDHSARTRDGLALIARVRNDPATKDIPLFIYAAELRPLQADTRIAADAYVRRPMALKLIHALDSVCGLVHLPHKPGICTTKGGVTEGPQESAEVTTGHSGGPGDELMKGGTYDAGISHMAKESVVDIR